MTLIVLYKLLAVLSLVVVGWLAARRGWLSKVGHGEDVARVLGNVAIYIFVPALLFRTMVRQDLSALPWRSLAAFFLPALAFALLTWWGYRRAVVKARGVPGAEPATRAIAATYGNAVQLGIPLAAALFGESGLALHLALISVHGLVLLTTLTVLVEVDLAMSLPRNPAATASRWRKLQITLKTTVRNTVLHPVLLPVLLGLVWSLGGLGLHPLPDEALQMLGSAVVPVCLVLIGASLAGAGAVSHLKSAWRASALKLLLMPALVLLVAHWGFGLSGASLGVLVVMAAQPVGTNALIFAQRYQLLQAEASAAIVLSTFAFVGTLAFWLAVLSVIGR